MKKYGKNTNSSNGKEAVFFFLSFLVFSPARQEKHIEVPLSQGAKSLKRNKEGRGVVRRASSCYQLRCKIKAFCTFHDHKGDKATRWRTESLLNKCAMLLSAFSASRTLYCSPVKRPTLPPGLVFFFVASIRSFTQQYKSKLGSTPNTQK